MTIKRSIYLSDEKVGKEKAEKAKRAQMLQKQMTAQETIKHHIKSIRQNLKAFERTFAEKTTGEAFSLEEDALRRSYMQLMHSLLTIEPAVDWLSGITTTQKTKEI